MLEDWLSLMQALPVPQLAAVLQLRQITVEPELPVEPALVDDWPVVPVLVLVEVEVEVLVEVEVEVLVEVVEVEVEVEVELAVEAALALEEDAAPLVLDWTGRQ